MKKVILALLLLFAAIGVPCHADLQGTVGSLTWQLSGDSTMLIVSGKGEMIGSPWSFAKEKLKTIILQEGIGNISAGAFSGCTDLSEVKIPSTVAEIGYGAFRGCSSLSRCSLFSENCKIYATAFEGCPLSMEDDSIAYVGKYAVKYGGLNSGKSICIKEGTLGASFYIESSDTIQREKLVLPKSLRYFRYFRFGGSRRVPFAILDLYSERNSLVSRLAGIFVV